MRSQLLGWPVCVCVLFAFIAHSAAEQRDLSEECYELLHADDSPASEEEASRCRDEFLTVVVTAERAERELLHVPASVSAVSAQEIERASSVSVADALRDVPGVEISDAGEPGLKRVRIRGEESRRVAVFIDGQEFTDQREVGTPLLISPEHVERIEVIRGPASVMYGSRAIGGIINIITKKGGYHPLHGTVSGQYESGNDAFSESGSIYGSIDDFDYRMGISNASVEDRETARGALPHTGYDNQSVSAYFGYAPESHRIGLSYDAYNANSEIYVDPVVATTPPFLDFALDAPERDREKFALFYDWTPEALPLKALHVDWYSQVSDRELDTFSTTLIEMPQPVIAETSIFTTSKLHSFGFNSHADFDIGESHRFISGLQLIDDDLNQDRVRGQVIGGLPAPDQLVHDEVSQSRTGVFVQDEVSISENWRLTLGGRGDAVSTRLSQSSRAGLEPSSSFDDSLTGQAAINYLGIDDANVWLRFAQGFVAPSPIQLGTGAFAGPSFINPNRELEPETSDSFELGARYMADDLTAELVAFYSEADEFIDDVLCSGTAAACIEPTSARDRVYINRGSARSFGVEASARYAFEWVEPYASITFIRRRVKTDEYSTYDTGVPTTAGRLGARHESEIHPGVHWWGDFYLRAESDAPDFDGTTLDDRAGWATVNLSSGVEFGQKRQYKLILGLENLGDKYYTASTENIPARGRSLLVRLVVNYS